MASGVFDDALIKHLWSSDELRAIFSDRNRVQKWYDYEAALAREQAGLGIIPSAAADEIAAHAKVDQVDIESIAAEIRRIKHPLVPALKALQQLCRPGLGEYVHFGPTTQDVLDTGTVLQIKDAHAVYLRDMKALGKIANQIYMLEHNEIDELAEPFSEGKVGSSTMPHKRNPSTCEAVIGVARAIKYNVAPMLESMVIEHERDGAAWRAEWRAVPESCLMAGGMLATMKSVLSGLVVNVGKMRSNLDLLGGFLLSERVMFALAGKVGKQTAHGLVYQASMHGIENGITFEKALMENKQVREALGEQELRAALDPTTYVGHAPEIVDDVLARVRASGWLN